MNIDKYKNLTLEEFEKIISQENIIQTEREITYKGITYTLNDAGYYRITQVKTARGYDEKYSGIGKNVEETKSINRGTVELIQSIIADIEEDEIDVFIERK